MNYNSSQVGVPYVRADVITILYPENQLPSITVSQTEAVKLADGKIIQTKRINDISFQLDIAAHGTEPIPIVDPTTGAPLGVNTNLQGLMLGILAVIRQQQLLQNP